MGSLSPQTSQDARYVDLVVIGGLIKFCSAIWGGNLLIDIGGPTGLLSAVLARQQGLSVAVIGMLISHYWQDHSNTSKTKKQVLWNLDAQML